MQRWEIFTIQGKRVGGLWREYADSILTTRIGFRADPDEAAFLAESVIRFQDDGESWERFRFRQEPGAVDVDCVRLDAGLPEDSLPSYGEYMLLLDVISDREAGIPSDEAAETYVRLLDSDPDQQAAAEVVVAGTDVIDVGETSVEAERLDVVQGGTVVGRHWAADDVLVRSDWNGPVSWHADQDQVLADVERVDPEAARFLRNGFGG